MFVKICGITRPEDAKVALELGADALGFVFWPKSPRFIDCERAKAIIAGLPSGVMTVGVFVNQPAREVNDLAARTGLSAVQLHGDESIQDARDITRPIIKAVTPASDGAIEAEWPDDVTLLVDAYDPVNRGGTGKRADWMAARALARRRKVLLAGGLNPENVADAIAQVQPFGIDVSSGVELKPGIKDHQRLANLFRAIAQPFDQ